MEKIGIFFGSTTGNTEEVARLIGGKLGVDNNDIMDISSASPELFLDYDVLILGSSTWGAGDLQDDWYGVIDKLSSMNLSDKKVAVFGTGDSSSYSDTFCDAIGQIAEAAEKANALLIGNHVDASEYSYDESIACRNGEFCGLPIDEDNESSLTDARVSKWVEQLKSEVA